MTEQTEAQRLADELVALHGYPLSIKAAAELRRLDAELMRKSDAIQRLWAERDSLRSSMEHCDRCGKKLGGEGDIHTCTPKADPIGDAQDKLIAEMAAQPEQKWQYGTPLLNLFTKQPVQEPVAWISAVTGDVTTQDMSHTVSWVPLTTPPAAQPAPVQGPVHQWREKHSAYWYDGYPDNDDGGGPYETRTLYATPPAAAQRQPLEPVVPEGKEIYHLPAFRLGWKTAEAAHGIKENT